MILTCNLQQQMDRPTNRHEQLHYLPANVVAKHTPTISVKLQCHQRRHHSHGSCHNSPNAVDGLYASVEHLHNVRRLRTVVCNVLEDRHVQELLQRVGKHIKADRRGWTGANLEQRFGEYSRV